MAKKNSDTRSNTRSNTKAPKKSKGIDKARLAALEALQEQGDYASYISGLKAIAKEDSNEDARLEAAARVGHWAKDPVTWGAWAALFLVYSVGWFVAKL